MMIDRDVAVVTVLHKKSFPADYIKSLSNQRYQWFDLVVFIHNTPAEIINKFVTILNSTQNIKYRIKVFKIPSKLTISQAREYLFKKLINLRYKKIILTDSDDFYTPSHVETMLNAIENHDLAFSDSFVYTSSKDYTYNSIIGKSKSFKTFIDKLVPKAISWDFILDKNCLGFGNTSLNLDFIKDIPIFPKKILAIDWWFYAYQMYTSKVIARFTKKATIFYRIHKDTSAGFFEISEEFLRRGLNVKVLHYYSLTNLDPVFQELYEKFLTTKEYFEKDSYFKSIYLKKIKLLYSNKQFLWWEPIRDYTEVIDNEGFKNCKN